MEVPPASQLGHISLSTTQGKSKSGKIYIYIYKQKLRINKHQ